MIVNEIRCNCCACILPPNYPEFVYYSECDTDPLDGHLCVECFQEFISDYGTKLAKFTGERVTKPPIKKSNVKKPKK